MAWRAEVLIPAHRIVVALAGGEVVDLRSSSTFGTFGAYRELPDAVHGMIAWPNTVLLTGPENVVVDPGYQTQGDMLAAALAAHGVSPDDVHTVPQLGDVELHVHAAELETPHAHAGRGWRDRATARPFSGSAGEVLPGVRWIHTPGHTDGHVAFLVETDDGLVAIAGDTPGPDPSWFAQGSLPADHPRREEHLAAFRAIRDSGARLMIPGHNPPAPVEPA